MESSVSFANDEDINKDNKREIDNKVARILKLIKSSGQDKKGKSSEDSSKRSELIGLIQDFYTEYQSLYAQYEHVRGEIGKRNRGRKEKENSSSAPSSDSEEYYSSEDIENGALSRHNKASDMANKEVETANFDEAGLKPILISTALDKESLTSKYMAAFGKSPRTRKREHSNLVKALELHGNQASAQINGLEGQLYVLRTELESLRSLKIGLEKKIEEKETEARQLGETNVQLRSRVSELELISEDKGNEISAMTVRMKENENNLTSRIEVLLTQVNNLQQEMESLRAEKAELVESKRNGESAQVKGLKDQANILQQKLESLSKEKTELLLQLDIKTKEITENQTWIETLKKELARKVVLEQGLLKEKEGFVVQMEDLKLEVNSPHDQNNKLEELIRSRNRETDELREEKGRLQARISELEGSLVNKGQELSIVKKKFESKKNEASTQIMSLKAKVNNLQQELDSLLCEKSKLEAHNDRLKQDSAHSQMQVENEILNLTIKIEDQQKTLKEKESSIKKFTEEQKLTKHLSLDSQKQRPESPKYRSMDSTKLSHQVIERKIDELAEKFHMKMENHIRLLFQRIRVAEQIHAETKDAYKKMLEKLEQENTELNGKKAIYEAELMKMREILLSPESNLLKGLDLMIRKIDEENGNFLNRISRISKELQRAKDWITGKNEEIKKLKYNVESLTSQLDEKEEEEFLLKEKVEKLDTEISSEGLEECKPNVASQLERTVEDLERQLKERDDIFSNLGEEKREAIRQLCVLIDYHRQRYDHLKESVSKMPIKFKKPA
ncbi:hypothetical protein P3X46_016809 [Hevea brasiliensis]|uniref:NAB domain-containing protein n=1 Tax=Hevea brasiliensis TaxID=3981 RepID=A0ABQ9M0B2_HEVBR|nr:COP1-interactive protein 1 [Hevea brasiliensis]XP_058009699.1 COP1-interactive protein 1 [Hevea brasiliensis]KAJ9173699.1 hypothetical protein P3X46_016809 [Hevea brasiliensis]